MFGQRTALNAGGAPHRSRGSSTRGESHRLGSSVGNLLYGGDATPSASGGNRGRDRGDRSGSATPMSTSREMFAKPVSKRDVPAGGRIVRQQSNDSISNSRSSSLQRAATGAPRANDALVTHHNPIFGNSNTNGVQHRLSRGAAPPPAARSSAAGVISGKSFRFAPAERVNRVQGYSVSESGSVTPMGSRGVSPASYREGSRAGSVVSSRAQSPASYSNYQRAQQHSNANSPTESVRSVRSNASMRSAGRSMDVDIFGRGGNNSGENLRPYDADWKNPSWISSAGGRGKKTFDLQKRALAKEEKGSGVQRGERGWLEATDVRVFGGREEPDTAPPMFPPPTTAIPGMSNCKERMRKCRGGDATHLHAGHRLWSDEEGAIEAPPRRGPMQYDVPPELQGAEQNTKAMSYQTAGVLSSKRGGLMNIEQLPSKKRVPGGGRHASGNRVFLSYVESGSGSDAGNGQNGSDYGGGDRRVVRSMSEAGIRSEGEAPPPPPPKRSGESPMFKTSRGAVSGNVDQMPKKRHLALYGTERGLNKNIFFGRGERDLGSKSSVEGGVLSEGQVYQQNSKSNVALARGRTAGDIDAGIGRAKVFSRSTKLNPNFTVSEDNGMCHGAIVSNSLGESLVCKNWHRRYVSDSALDKVGRVIKTPLLGAVPQLTTNFRANHLMGGVLRSRR